MTGELKIPLPVAKVHGSPCSLAGASGLKPVCAEARRNLGQGLWGSSGTSYEKTSGPDAGRSEHEATRSARLAPASTAPRAPATGRGIPERRWRKRGG